MQADTRHDLRPIDLTDPSPDLEARVDDQLVTLDDLDPLAGDLSAARAPEIRQALLDRLAAPGPLAIALSSVTSIDAAGLQLLLAARRAAEARGHELRFVDLAEPVRHLFERIGFAP